MARVLTVDDSRAIRMIVGKVLAEMGLEVSEAEDGEKGLAVLEEVEFDLVVLDVTMPVLDGPGMLARMREAGNKTPVLVLTSESKRSTVAELLKLGIEDYILKPFKNEDLKAKIVRILNGKDPGLLQSLGAGRPNLSPTPAAPAEPNLPERQDPPASGRQFADVLVVDDMDNVAKRLRALIPTHISLMSAANGQGALKLAREASFRLVLIDRELPDMPGATLLKQLRVLQPSAACLAMSLRTSPTVGREVKEEGFDDLLAKPFSQEAVDDLLQNLFQTQEQLVRENDVLSACVYSGRPERVEKYYSRLVTLSKEAIRGVAEACFESVIFDGTKLPPHPAKMVQLMTELETLARSFGLSLRVVALGPVERALKEYDETKAIPIFEDIAKARGFVA